MELFQENILYVPSVIDPNDWLLFVLFGKNVFTVNRQLHIYIKSCIFHARYVSSKSNQKYKNMFLIQSDEKWNNYSRSFAIR